MKIHLISRFCVVCLDNYILNCDQNKITPGTWLLPVEANPVIKRCIFVKKKGYCKLSACF